MTRIGRVSLLISIHEVRFSPLNWTDLLCLQLGSLRCLFRYYPEFIIGDLNLSHDDDNGRTDCFTPYTCTQGVVKLLANTLLSMALMTMACRYTVGSSHNRPCFVR